MLRSLFAGVSGLRNHQTMMDVIGNNIANVNTTGFKSGRVSFKDIVSQTISGASAGDASVGGTNPKQVGLGMTIGSIDTDFSQGNLQFTGKITDLAVQGEGMFKVSDGSGDFYTRNGAFELDANGYLVSTANGFIVQGKNATAGVIAGSATVENILIPTGTINQPQATTGMDLVGNLNSSDTQKGSIYQTEALLAEEESTASSNMATSTLTAKNISTSATSQITGISTTSQVQLTFDGNTETYTYGTAAAGNDEFENLQELVTEMSDMAGLTVAISNGIVSYTNGSGGAVTDLAISVSGGGASNLQAALAPTTASVANGASVDSTASFYHNAEGSDLLVNVANSSGTNLGIVNGNSITIGADVGGTAQSGTLAVVAASSSLDSLTSQIDSIFNIENSSGVAMSSGALKVTGDGGTNYIISDIDIQITGNTDFNNVFQANTTTTTNWTRLQSAEDNYSTSIVVFDEGGTSHTATIQFNIRDSGKWVYDISAVETSSSTAETVTGGTGEITFNGDGSPNSSDDINLLITPADTTKADISITIDMGTASAFAGLVSFETDSGALFKNQDGFAAGTLKDITIDTSGIIRGTFTNGKTQDLSQVVLAKFDNSGGLQKQGDSMFIQTVNSGTGVDGDPGIGGRGTIANGTLEASNVDLASQFTTMITTQRGFQTNARVITTSDQILQELVNLKR